MAFDATTIMQLVLLLTWTCLSTCPSRQKHPIFTTILSSQEYVEQLLSSVSLVFAPGLFDVIQASTPPTIAWFKTLPTLPVDWAWHWAVYLLVLEKPGCRTRVYIGSGTAALYGIHGRFGNYRTGNSVPVYVQKSLQEGYIIVHKGLLCWLPIPPVGSIPLIRLLIVTLEAVFTFIFWSLKAQTDYGYGMSHMCPWDRKSLEYDGLCSHNPLTDAPASDHELSAEELEAQNAEIIKRIKQHKKEYRQEVQRKNPEEYRTKQVAKSRSYMDRFPEKIKESHNRTVKKAVAEKRHHCVLCNSSFRCAVNLRRHLTSAKHIARAKRAEDELNGTDSTNYKFYCDVCKQTFTRKAHMDEHFAGSKHATRVARTEQAIN